MSSVYLSHTAKDDIRAIVRSELERNSREISALKEQLADADRVNELVKARHAELEAENAMLRAKLQAKEKS